MEMCMQTKLTIPEAQYSNACPTFFRAHVLQARRSRHGYEEAGYHLAIHARQLVDGDVNEDVLDQLDEILEDGATAAENMWRWLRATMPRCMALVPSRRKATFLRGVQAAIDEGRV